MWTKMKDMIGKVNTFIPEKLQLFGGGMILGALLVWVY